MKVIFLDIDGILNPWANIIKANKGADQYGFLFEKRCVDVLSRIIELSQAKIVISSTWGHSGLLVMQELWATRKLPGEVIGVTKNLGRSGDFIDGDEFLRGKEVEEWLSKNQTDGYLILDDCDQFLNNQQANFLHVEGDRGLDETHILKAVEILNKS